MIVWSTTRVPLSNDVIAYLASEVYDARDAKSISRAEIRGRQQAWAYLNIGRGVRCRHCPASLVRILGLLRRLMQDQSLTTASAPLSICAGLSVCLPSRSANWFGE